MKIALAMIVKGTEEESKLLDRCLENVAPHIDGIFITSTYKHGKAPSEAVNFVCERYGAKVEEFEWVNNFAEARNFSFAQVPKEYDYILWCDADDVFRGLEKLKDTIEAHPNVDAFAFNYLYDFDKYKNPTVVHKKTQIVRNDGCVEWVGALHEDFKENRALMVKFVDGIERMHFTTDERFLENQIRNIEIAQTDLDNNPEDPRGYYNLGNSYLGANKHKLAKKNFDKFLELSSSDDEKYIIRQRLSSVEHALGNREKAMEHLQVAIGMNPLVPDAYCQLGYLCFEYNMLDKAEEYLLMGLKMKPQYHKMIVYNPRDYDYNPMMALAKVYFNKSRGDLALTCLKGCAKIYPKDEYIKIVIADMEKEVERMNKVLDAVKHIETLGDDKEKILYTINKLDSDLQAHPAICRIRNEHFIKDKSSGKDIAYYCGETKHEWNPDLFKTKGFGGSEEAVINLAKEWAKQGYNVTVFNSCGIEPMTRDGVIYRPFWMYNAKDKYDYTVLWRSPRLADHDLNTTKLFVDLHDVVQEGEFNEKRLKKIDKIFVKTKFHRSLFPNVPDEKFVILPNGQDFEILDGEYKKDPYLLVNTSSPDRSLDVLPKLFAEVKKQVPEAKCKWAYGWEIFDNAFSTDKKMMAWKDQTIKAMEDAGIENLGRLTQAECAKLYQEGRILAYPSEFAEIDCISVKKAQACGAMPITTDFGAFDESVQHGIKIKSKKTKDNWTKPYQFSFGMDDPAAQKKWVDAVVTELRKPIDWKKTTRMQEWARKFSWDLIAKEWTRNLS